MLRSVESRFGRAVYIKDGDDTNWTLGSFWTQTTKQVPTERKQEEHKEGHQSTRSQDKHDTNHFLTSVIGSISSSQNKTDDEDDDGGWVLESSTAGSL